MAEKLYLQREKENDRKFDQLAKNLNRFRNVLDEEIQNLLIQESLILDSVGDKFNNLTSNIKKTNKNLLHSIKKQPKFSKFIAFIFLIIIIISIYKKLSN